MRPQKYLAMLAVLVAFSTSDLQANTAGDNQLLSTIEKVPPPPKSINDLVKVLDSSRPELETIRKKEAIADSKPADNLDRTALYNFYKNRAKAAEELGRVQQLKRDCQLQLQYVGSDPNLKNDSYRDCIQAEFLDGNPLAAIALLKKTIAELPPNQMYGWHMSFNMLLVNAYRQIGDFKSAEVSMRDIDGLIILLRRGPSWAELGDHWTYQAERARGEYLQAEGKHVAAELSFIRALVAIDSRIKQLESGMYGQSTRRLHDPNSGYFSKAIVMHRLGNSLLAQRKLVEAEYYLRSSLTTYLRVSARNSTSVAGVLNALAYCVAEQGRVNEALILAQYANQVIQEAGIRPASTAMIYSRKALAASYVNAEKYAEALEQFKLMRSAIDQDADAKERIRNLDDLDEVVARIYMKDPAGAQKIVESMYQKNLTGVGKNHPRTAWTQAFLGMTLQDQGLSKEARAHFDQAMSVLIDQARNDSENQTISLKFQKRFSIIIESYISVLFVEAQANPAQAKDLIARAFQLADMARGSSVQRALTQSTARSNIKDPKLELLARKEQDLQRRANSLNELLVSLSAAPASRQLPGVQAKMREDIESLKAERNSVKKEIENKYPEYFDLVEPKPITIARTAATIKNQEVLITWYFGDRKSYVWAVHSSGLDSFSELNVTKKEIAADVEKLRKALDPGVSSVDEIPPFDVTLSYKLYNLLIKPVEGSLHNKNLLISIPHANLGQLPIGTLLTAPIKQPGKGANTFIAYQNAPWLIRKIAISQLPSVNALAALRSAPSKSAQNQSFIAFADPYFSKDQAQQKPTLAASLNTRGIPLRLRNAPKTSKVSSAELALLPPLPDTSLEVKEIAAVLGAKDGDIYLHEQANVSQVLKTDFKNKNIIMFSTHGLVPGELDGLTQPALALSTPEVTGEKDTDGLLTMDKILDLKLNADWVVLSACNTASGDGNSEAVSGLGRAFFYAGARALLVSNWPVDTVASRELMTDLFKRQAGDPNLAKAESLRRAMLELADKGGYKDPKTKSISYAYGHPLFWAPFVVVGD